MAQTKHEILAMLEQAQMRPRHRFGQNFMIDGNLVRLIADSGMIQSGDLVIEVGPGTGTLTDEILARSANVLAVEIDRDLSDLLRNRFIQNSNFTLIEGDALAGKHAVNDELFQRINDAKQAGKTVRLVSNLPYNIASPLVVELLIAGVDMLVFTVQKELAERLAANPVGKEFGPLSIMVQMLGRVEILRTLGPKAFWPMPSVDSALVRISRDNRLQNRAHDFGVFIHKIFSSRRKTLRKALANAGIENPDQILADAKILPTVRPEEIEPADFWKLFAQ
jgi:16S rRNA (adenine1518-N6/adenine1519-N6)-dimethyltransferase